MLQKTALTFDASVWEFFAPLLSGACLVMAHPDAHRNPDAIADALCRDRIAVLQVVPTFFRALLQHGAFVGARSLRHMACGGEALASDAVERFRQHSGAVVHNLYGPTEACIDATAWHGDSVFAVEGGRG
jgi:non-ribosomal peptide synthetase component F